MSAVGLAGVVEQIGGLEPIAGAGLAINLAYLALDRFRYRRQIEPVAEAQCKSNDEKAAFDEFHDLEPVKELKWLAKRETSRVHTPKGKGALVYRFMFRKHQDIAFAVGASILCGFTLVVGVSANVGRWEWTQYLLYTLVPAIMFYGCVVALIVPAACVALGWRCVTWGQNRVRACTAQVAIHLKALATNAEAPLPANANQEAAWLARAARDASQGAARAPLFRPRRD